MKMAMDNFDHERSNIAEIDFTKDQADKMETAKTWLVFHQPFFAHLILAQLPIVATHSVPIAATDAFSIFINPDTFFDRPVQEQAFILCHEVLHCVFGDPILFQNWGRAQKVPVGHNELPFDDDYLQWSMDYIINAQLIKGNVGRKPGGCLYEEKYSKEGMEAVVDVYEQVLKDQPPKNKNPFDKLLPPGAGKPDQPAPKRDDLQWQQQIASAAQAADMMGKLPDNMKRLIGEILDPKVSWQDHLRTSMMRINGSDGLDWAAADRRMMSRGAVGHENVYFGRPTGFGAGTIVVGVDTSGSIGDAQVARFFAEMHGIIEDINPRELVVMWCDAKVQRIDYVEDTVDLESLRCKGAPGGGGTSFTPVFKKIERKGIEPDMLIYLTDMYGSFPEQEPNYPVIWGSISGVDKAPFGEVIHIDD